MWMVNDELDVEYVIFTLLQEKDPGQDPGQTRGKNYEFSFVCPWEFKTLFQV